MLPMAQGANSIEPMSNDTTNPRQRQKGRKAYSVAIQLASARNCQKGNRSYSILFNCTTQCSSLFSHSCRAIVVSYSIFHAGKKMQRMCGSGSKRAMKSEGSSIDIDIHSYPRPLVTHRFILHNSFRNSTYTHSSSTIIATASLSRFAMDVSCLLACRARFFVCFCACLFAFPVLFRP